VATGVLTASRRPTPSFRRSMKSFYKMTAAGQASIPEVYHEVSFCAVAGGPLRHTKKQPRAEERLTIWVRPLFGCAYIVPTSQTEETQISKHP
jgi:hypothetical protein